MIDGSRTRTTCLLSLAAFLLVPPSVAVAQDAKPARIALMRVGAPPPEYLAAFRKGLGALGITVPPAILLRADEVIE